MCMGKAGVEESCSVGEIPISSFLRPCMLPFSGEHKEVPSLGSSVQPERKNTVPRFQSQLSRAAHVRGVPGCMEMEP